VYLLLTGSSFSDEISVPKTPSLNNGIEIAIRSWTSGSVYSRLAAIPYDEQKSLSLIRGLIDRMIRPSAAASNGVSAYRHTAIRNLKGHVDLNNKIEFESVCGGYSRLSQLTGNKINGTSADPHNFTNLTNNLVNVDYITFNEC
jgi:hypothetical protein